MIARWYSLSEKLHMEPRSSLNTLGSLSARSYQAEKNRIAIL
jgi:hypothetical protein